MLLGCILSIFIPFWRRPWRLWRRPWKLWRSSRHVFQDLCEKVAKCTHVGELFEVIFVFVCVFLAPFWVHFEHVSPFWAQILKNMAQILKNMAQLAPCFSGSVANSRKMYTFGWVFWGHFCFFSHKYKLQKCVWTAPACTDRMSHPPENYTVAGVLPLSR